MAVSAVSAAAAKAAPKAETPKAEAPKAEAPAAAQAITSAAVFEGVRFYVAEHPELVKQVGTVYQFKLTGPDSAWLLDLKNGAGSLTAGTGIALSGADRIVMNHTDLPPPLMCQSSAPTRRFAPCTRA